MTTMQKTRTTLLVRWLLCMICIASGTLSDDGYSGFQAKHRINLVNYVAEVGHNVDILSPITPAPIGMQWFSLNIDGELPRPVGRGGRVATTYLKKFMETYNTSWHSIFRLDKLNERLKIRKVQLGYADLFRVVAGENRTGEAAESSSADGQTLDVAFALITFETHECGFTSKPENPKAGDTLVLSCSIIFNGMWNASLIFRNDYDESEIVGETKTCANNTSVGTTICNSVTLLAETDVLAYGCHLEFPADERLEPNNPMFRSSTWTNEFNKDVVCYLPKIYLEAIPSDVSLLCNNLPCGETAEVNDIVTCVAHGYPQPVFDIRIGRVSEEQEDKSDSNGVHDESEVFMDDNDEARDDGASGDYSEYSTEMEIKGSEDVQLGPTLVGRINITCNVSNELGWGFSSLILEVKSSLPEPETDLSDDTTAKVQAGAAAGDFFAEEHGKPTFRLEDYSFLKNHQINLVNYVAAVGSDVTILSPIIPIPIGIRWLSQYLHDEENLPPSDTEFRLTALSDLVEFNEEHRTPWKIEIDHDEHRRWIVIHKIPVGYADVFRVIVDAGQKGNSSFDVLITLMTYEKHECGYVSKPTDLIEGDALDLECSVIVNGIWNTSLVFRNAYDGSEVRGDTTERNGSNIRSTVTIKADTDILAYSCHLEFPSIARQYLESRIFQNSKWTDVFNKEVVCYLPEVYLDAIPSDVAFLCDNMPCGDTASVNDTVTCVAHGYPQPVFDLRIHHLTNKSTDPNSENYDDRLFLDTADGASEVPIKGSENYRISQADVGEIEVTCNVSNSLGWGFNSFKMEISLLRPPDSSRNSSGMVRVDDYSYWLKDHEIMLVNYVAEVGMNVLIASPITPAPLDVRWLSLKTGGELSHRSDEGLGTAQYVNKNDTWRLSAFEYDASDGSLKILNVRLDDADVFRVIANENMTGEAIGQTFDVLITLVVFEKHECDITKSPTLGEGDTVILSCSVIVNGMWDVSLIFRNNYDESEIIGETKKCGFQPSVGSMICSSVNVQAKTNILAYVCRLGFFPSKRQEPKNSADRSSKWTTDFTTTADCYVPKAYLNAIPSDVSFLCNNMPCEDTVLVKDTVTCMAHGYPQPVFDLRIRKLSVDTNKTRNGQELDADNDKKDDFFLDTSDESSEEEIKGFKDYLIRQEDVGHVELTCNVSNALGWGYNSLPLEVIGAGDTEVTGGRDSEIFTHKTLTDFTIIISPDSMGAEDTLEPVTEQDASTNSGFNEVSLSHSDLKVLIMCDEIRCGENHTLFVGDQISCIGDGNLTFNRIELTVNRKRTEGDSDGVKYVLQMADIGDITVECIANSSSGSSVVRTVSIIVRQNETGQGMAAGEIDVDEGEQIVVKPTAKPDSRSDSIEESASNPKDDKNIEEAGQEGTSKPSIGSGRESFVLLQLFLVFVAAFVGFVQF